MGKNMAHFEQALDKDLFRYYDYGSEAANYDHYHQPSPPIWNLADVACPVALFVGENDALTPSQDVRRLIDELPNGKLVQHQTILTYSHTDFLWGSNVADVVYPDVIKI